MSLQFTLTDSEDKQFDDWLFEQTKNQRITEPGPPIEVVFVMYGGFEMRKFARIPSTGKEIELINRG